MKSEREKKRDKKNGYISLLLIMEGDAEFCSGVFELVGRSVVVAKKRSA